MPSTYTVEHEKLITWIIVWNHTLLITFQQLAIQRVQLKYHQKMTQMLWFFAFGKRMLTFVVHQSHSLDPQWIISELKTIKLYKW